MDPENYEDQVTDDNDIPDNDKGAKPADPVEAFEAEVSSVVDQMVQDEKGNWQLPDGLEASPQVIVAARYAKRHRDTQSAFTKDRQRLKALETAKSKLEEHVLQTATMHLSDDQREELDELKLRDPDQWREKLNEYETQARDILRTKLQTINTESEQASELEIRQAKLEAFVESTGIELNDDVIEEQLPAKFTKDLEAGKTTFDEFLEQAREFLETPKVVKGAKDKVPGANPDLGKAPGGSKPSPAATAGDIVSSYDKEVY